MRFKRSIITAALALPLLVGGIALAATSGGSQEHAAQTKYTPVWHNNPTTVGEAVDLGAVVVRATVVGVSQAPDIVVPAQGEPGNIDRIPTQTITMRTSEVLKGSVGATFTVFRTGGKDTIVTGDPEYRIGQEYVLILDDQRPDGRWVLVSPEGRYELNGGKVYAISEVPGVEAVNGRTYSEFRSLVKG